MSTGGAHLVAPRSDPLPAYLPVAPLAQLVARSTPGRRFERGPHAAVAAGPQIERVDIADEPTRDDFLSSECGFEVLTGAIGFFIARDFLNEDRTGQVALTTLNVKVTATANGNTVRFHDVGADSVRREPDGSLVVSIIGQIPFDFNGVLKFDPDTGELLHEPQFNGPEQVQRLCEALAPLP